MWRSETDEGRSAALTAALPGRPVCTVSLAITASGTSKASSAPWCMTAIRSASPTTTSIWCSTISTVFRSSRCTEPISSTSPSTSSTETPAIGSSSRITRGSAASSIASSSLRLSPCESIPAGASGAIGEADPLERPRRTIERRPVAGGTPPEAERAAEVRLGGEAHVLADREQREDARDLERAPEPGLRAAIGRIGGDVPPVELDRARGRVA